MLKTRTVVPEPAKNLCNSILFNTVLFVEAQCELVLRKMDLAA